MSSGAPCTARSRTSPLVRHIVTLDALDRRVVELRSSYIDGEVRRW